jgi:hypothetical protein
LCLWRSSDRLFLFRDFLSQIIDEQEIIVSKYLFFLSLSLLCIFGCSNSTTDSHPNELFTISITESYLNTDLAFVLLSDQTGETLAYKEFATAQTYEFSNELNHAYQDKINITYGTVSMEAKDNHVSLVTRNAIPAGRHWTLSRTSIEKQNYPDISFTDIPENDGYLLSAAMYKSNSISPLEFDNIFAISAYEGYPQLYLVLNCDGDFQYQWWNGIPSGPVPLNQLESASSSLLIYPGIGSSVDYSFLGYVNASDHKSSYFHLGLGYSLPVQPELTLHYPPQKFEEFNTKLTIYENADDLYYYSYYGELPNEIVHYEGDFVFDEILQSEFTITPEGILDVIYSYWSATNLSWWMYGPEDVFTQNLPNLPAELLALMPVNSMENINLASVSICDYDTINNYNETWAILCESSEDFTQIVNKYNVRIKVIPNSERINLTPEIISPVEF